MVTEWWRFLMLSFFFNIDHVFCGTEYAETGKNHTFTPTVKGTFQTILWKFQNDKLVEYESDGLVWYRLQDRGALNTKSGQLTIMKLEKDDMGQYQSEIQVSGTLHNSFHYLQVMDGVSEPTVNCDVAPEGTRILNCSVTNPLLVDFEWSGPEKLTQKGQTLNVAKETGNESIYFCTATNKVSQKSKQFTLGDCYTSPPVSGTIIAVAVVIPLILVAVALVYKFWGKIREYLPVPAK